MGAVRVAGSYRRPTLGIDQVAAQAFYMGQGLMLPPTVEGWHEGRSGSTGGALVERVNFVANELADPSEPGVHDIIERLAAQNGGSLTPSEAVDGCLDLMGSVEVEEDTRAALTEHVGKRGELEPQRPPARRRRRAARRRGAGPDCIHAGISASVKI